MWSPALSAISRAFLAANVAAQKTAADKTASQTTPGGTSSQGEQVSLSPEGLARAAMYGSANSDISQSGLPESVQKILTSVRISQKGVQQMNSQLQAITNDKSLTAEMRLARTSALQTVSAIYQRQISSSTSDLASAMNTLQLNKADKAKASMLVLAKM